MHQLTCNGVLEGIRICMRGFPNRMLYPDYKGRYQILGAAEIATATDNKAGVYALMDKIDFSRDRYRLGHTKVLSLFQGRRSGRTGRSER
jgi:myosin heavy chain 6/7